MMAWLEQDMDIILSRLLRAAAVRVGDNAVDDDATAIDDFLQQVVDYALEKRKEGHLFLQKVLEDLMQRDELGGEGEEGYHAARE
jgi:hypothetical protein